LILLFSFLRVVYRILCLFLWQLVWLHIFWKIRMHFHLYELEGMVWRIWSGVQNMTEDWETVNDSNKQKYNIDKIDKGSYFSVLRHWGKVTKKNINNTYLNNLIHKDVAIRTKFQTSKLVNGNINYRENTPEDIY
jgi:hypothetical protein